MALTVEDGSGVTGANSYVTVDYIKAFCLARGLVLPTPDSAIEVFAVQAFDYVESYRTRYQGSKTDSAQRTQFPRTGVVIDGYYLPSGEIPAELKDAQCQATFEASETDLMPNSTSGIKKEKVDVLEVEYQDAPGGVAASPSFPKVDNLLSSLFNSGGGWRPSVVRG
jgi:hypothetical protein